MQMMIVGVVMMMVVLKARHDYGERAFDVNWLRYVARHRNIFFLNDWDMSNPLHKHGNLLLNCNLFHLPVIPIADIISRPRIILDLVDLLFHPLAFFGDDRFR